MKQKQQQQGTLQLDHSGILMIKYDKASFIASSPNISRKPSALDVNNDKGNQYSHGKKYVDLQHLEIVH